MEKIEVNYEIEVTLRVLGGKWKALILNHLIKDGPQRFNELHRFIGQTSQRTLTNQLRELEHDGLVIRTVFAEIPPRVEYSISDKGLSLKKILELMCEWGYRNAGDRYTILNGECLRKRNAQLAKEKKNSTL